VVSFVQIQPDLFMKLHDLEVPLPSFRKWCGVTNSEKTTGTLPSCGVSAVLFNCFILLLMIRRMCDATLHGQIEPLAIVEFCAAFFLLISLSKPWQSMANSTMATPQWQLLAKPMSFWEFHLYFTTGSSEKKSLPPLSRHSPKNQMPALPCH